MRMRYKRVPIFARGAVPSPSTLRSDGNTQHLQHLDWSFEMLMMVIR